MKRELKKSIKEDELVTGAERLAQWVAANRRLVQATALGLAAVVGGSWAWNAWQARQAREAEAAFAAALEVYGAPVRNELPEGNPPPAGATVHETAAEKFKKAAAAMDGVERRFASHPVGRRARYFAALARAESGDVAEARKLLEPMAAPGGDPLLTALARLALAGLLRKAGEPGKAAEEYRKLATDPGWPLPKDHALMQLAESLEEARRAAEARDAYKRVVDEFPSSIYASEARRRADSLATAG